MNSIDAGAAGRFKIGDRIINRLGYGAMRITGRGIWGPPPDRRAALATLRRLPEIGVNVIDTADSYGPDVSEELIREALHPYDGLLIATKAGLTRPGPDQWEPNGHPDHLISQAKGSLRKLGVKQIALWQLHRIDPKVPREEQFGAVRQLLDEGVIRYAGLSEVSVADIEAARRVFPVATVQNRYNLVDRGSEDVLAYLCRQQHRFHSLVSAGRGRTDRTRRACRSHREGTWCDDGPGRAGMAAPAQPSYPADPRHAACCAFGRKRGGGWPVAGARRTRRARRCGLNFGHCRGERPRSSATVRSEKLVRDIPVCFASSSRCQSRPGSQCMSRSAGARRSSLSALSHPAEGVGRGKIKPDDLDEQQLRELLEGPGHSVSLWRASAGRSSRRSADDQAARAHVGWLSWHVP